MLASQHVEVPAPFPAISGDACLNDDGTISFVGEDGSPLAANLVPVYESKSDGTPFTTDDLAAAMNGETVTVTTQIVALNNAGAVEMRIESGGEDLATVTSPV